jgi:dihydropyrimidine dehydrogenase (NAD+) subunit PreT
MQSRKSKRFDEETNKPVRQFKINTSGDGLSNNDVTDNFDDLHPPLEPAQAVVDAARCIYCYDAPCLNACPTRIDIPKFIHQIRSGNIEGSAKTILSANIMGGTCARACPTEVLCEEACVVNHTEGSPVKIGQLQRFSVDHLIAKKADHPFHRKASTGKTIAVVGAGPAGLSFAHRSAMLGHAVTVYEAKQKAGGLNEFGLAAYKMVNDFAQREVEFLLGIGGIKIEYEQRLGSNVSLDDLRCDFDAVFIGAGLGSAHSLSLPGEDLSGVMNALEFIEQVRTSTDKSKIPVGNDVIVIGGGNTAIDAAVQAKCLGARNVTLVYRRGPDAMSATGWEQALATSNGVTLRFWATPHSFAGNDRISTSVFSETTEENDKLVPTGKTFELMADMVLKATGQFLDGQIFEGLQLENSKINVDGQYQTSMTGVFAGGDCISSGEDLTVQAVEDGKQAAICVDAYLNGAVEGDAA